jgi:hypothetical protein
MNLVCLYDLNGDIDDDGIEDFLFYDKLMMQVQVEVSDTQIGKVLSFRSFLIKNMIVGRMRSKHFLI